MASSAQKTGALLLILLLCRSCCIQPAAAYDADDYFPLTAGDTWMYLGTKNGLAWPYVITVEGNEEVDGRQGVLLQFTGVPRSHIYVAGEEGIFLVLQHIAYMGSDITGDFLSFPAAIDEGQTIEREVVFSSSRISDGSLQGTAASLQTITLEAVEDVRVPAGMFEDCLKMVYTLSYNESLDFYGEQRLVQWHARGVGPVKGILTYRWSSPWEGRKAERVTYRLLWAAVGGSSCGWPHAR